jgi:hypothetical protein
MIATSATRPRFARLSLASLDIRHFPLAVCFAEG